MKSPVLLPIIAAMLGLAGAVGAALVLQRAATVALDRVLDERLRGAGDSAALLLSGAAPDSDRLRTLMRANALENAALLDRDLIVLADAEGPVGGRINLLRADPARVAKAFEGEGTTGVTYSMGEDGIAAGYFPVRDPSGAIVSVLALEAGQAFAGDARKNLWQAFVLGLALALLAALALAVVAARWVKFEQHQREAAAKAAHGELLSAMAAAAAHEIRNPLSVIRATVELTKERASASLTPRDKAALEDILGEVERLRQLTEDFLDLAADRPLAIGRLSMSDLLEETVRAVELAFPTVHIIKAITTLASVDGDAGRLRQVFTNLLSNAAQAQVQGEIHLDAKADGRDIVVSVRDSGPGVPVEIRDRLFEPFVTSGKTGGTGLGLAISRRLVARHRGTLKLLSNPPPGATFEVRLPAAEG